MAKFTTIIAVIAAFSAVASATHYTFEDAAIAANIIAQGMKNHGKPSQKRDTCVAKTCATAADAACGQTIDCASPYQCDNRESATNAGACKAGAAVGAACNDTVWCATGNCKENVCAALPGSGEACEGQCAWGFYCKNSVCTAQVAVGGACTPSTGGGGGGGGGGECEGLFGVECDAATSKCVFNLFKGAVGEASYSFAMCGPSTAFDEGSTKCIATCTDSAECTADDATKGKCIYDAACKGHYSCYVNAMGADCTNANGLAAFTGKCGECLQSVLYGQKCTKDQESCYESLSKFGPCVAAMSYSDACPLDLQGLIHAASGAQSLGASLIAAILAIGAALMVIA